MGKKIAIHNRSLDSRKKNIQNWKVPNIVKKSILKFLEELELGKVNKGIKISESRQVKYLDMLKISLGFFNKPENKLTMKDIEGFEKAISSGEVKTVSGEPYAQNTKVDMRRALKVYLKWKLKERGIKLTDWLDTRGVKKTPDYLNEQEIVKLYKACKSSSERFLIALLFDSGARAEEFHNIRYEDIQLPDVKVNFVKIILKEEYSKTKGRTISLYWKYSLEAVSEYVRERERDGIRSDEAIYNKSYDSTRKFLQRIGHKILGKPIHYHLFRHSSATYYATRLNRQELCYRYGWAFSSDMPDVYISRSGMENKQLDEKMTNTELSDLQSKMAKMENIIKMMLDKEEDLKFIESKK